MSDVELLADGLLQNEMQSINKYEKDIDIVLERFAATEAEVKKELRRYTLSCANFLRSNGIEDNSKAGFVSAIILGLTNHESKLYQDTKSAINAKRATKSKRMLSDPIGKNSVKMLKNLLSQNSLSAYTIAEFIEQNKDNVSEILNFWILLVRDMLLITSGAEIINSDIMKFLNNQSALYDEKYLINAADVLNKAHEMCKRYVNNRALALYLGLGIKNFKG